MEKVMPDSLVTNVLPTIRFGGGGGAGGLCVGVRCGGGAVSGCGAHAQTPLPPSPVPAPFTAPTHLMVSRPLMCTPFKYVFTSGMPLPAASGSTKLTNPPATRAKPADMEMWVK